jgi:hypothetical protein
MADLTALHAMVQAVNDYNEKDPELGKVLIKISSAIDSLDRRITRLEDRPTNTPSGRPAPLARR